MQKVLIIKRTKLIGLSIVILLRFKIQCTAVHTSHQTYKVQE